MNRSELEIAIVDKETPWEACFRLEEFFANGGTCRLHDEYNWVGAAFTCSRKANDILSSEVKMAQRLAWAHLAISINESLDTSDECSGQLGRAMLDRVNMIIRFGVQPGDYICDLNRVVDYFLGGPNVQKALQENSKVPRRIRDLHSGVRIAAEELKALVSAGRLTRTDEIDKLISIVEDSIP